MQKAKIMLDFLNVMCYYAMALNVHALLAQLDRAFGYGPKGQEFESLTARHKRKDLPNRVGLFLLFHINRDENS